MAEEAKKIEEEVKKTDDSAAPSGAEGGEGGNKQGAEPPEVAELKKQLASQTERAEKAERERDDRKRSEQEALSTADKNAQKAVSAQEESVNNAVAAATANFEAARRKLREAKDSGDFAKEEEAIIELGDAQAAKRGAEYQKNNFENWKKSGGDKKEVVSKTESRFTKKEQDWIDRNPSFNNDTVFRGIVYAADEDAKRRGVVVDSDEYFSNIEKHLGDAGYDLKTGKRAIATARAETDPDPKREKRELSNTSSGAPPSGGTSGSSSNGAGHSKTFRMTPEHREAAAICYPDLHKKDPKAAEEKYAKRQLEISELKSQGKL